jgi:hypothetical protein
MNILFSEPAFRAGGTNGADFRRLAESPCGGRHPIKAGQELAERVAPATAAIKEPLRAAAVLPADESGVRAKGKLHWLPVAATDRLTDV